MMNPFSLLYLDLLRKHGSPGKYWPQWCKKSKTLRDREIVIIGAILTQKTSWHNAEIALRNLRNHQLLSIKSISELNQLDQLTDLLRPAGFFRSKPQYLYDLCTFIVNEYKDISHLMKENWHTLRNKLLSIKGVGPETADVILLYALDKLSFVIDTYTQRLVRGKHLSKLLDYVSLKSLFEKNLPSDLEIYQNLHALIIIEQKGKENSMMEKI